LLLLAAALVAAAAAAAAVLLRHGAAMGDRVPGGILVGDARRYDALARLLFGTFYRGVAADVASAAPAGARLLEVGCGPGHLSIELARRHHFDVTGLDLDPAMIVRARANADRSASGDERPPSFVLGDAGSLPFPDGSFDIVVSTFSVHHWADPTAGLGEIGRVLRPGGRALIWDFRPGGPHVLGPRHEDLPDPVQHARGTPLSPVGVSPWRWPLWFSVAQRIELIRPDTPSDDVVS
jgi:SAM-dependent methyltransferase